MPSWKRSIAHPSANAETGRRASRKSSARRRLADPHSREHRRRCAPGDIVIHSELALPAKGELGSGSMTKRIATRRLGGATQSSSAPTCAPSVGCRAAGRNAFAVIEYEDNGGRKTYQMTKDEIVVGRGGRDYWTDLKLDTLPDVSREHFRLRRDPARRQVFPEGPEPSGHHHQRRRRRLPASNWRAAKSATATWKRRCRHARASAWRAWCFWSSEAHRMVKTRVRCAGASDPGRVRTQQRGRVPHRRRIAASSWWWTASAGRPRARRRRRSRWSACARAWSARPAPPNSASARPSPWPTTRFCARRAANPNGRAWRACSRWWCWRTARRWWDTSAIRGSTRFARGEIRKITHDHSPVGEREDRGELSEADAMRHPRRNEVFRDVGSRGTHARRCRISSRFARSVRAGSALLLCSDGLSDQVPSGEIRAHRGAACAAIRRRRSRELIDAANRAGGKDNVTVLVVEGEQFKRFGSAAITAQRRAHVPAAILLAFAASGSGAGRGGRVCIRDFPVRKSSR